MDSCKEKSVSGSLLIWDSYREQLLSGLDEEYVVDWNGTLCGLGDNVVNISSIIEKDASLLRARYLSFVFDCGSQGLDDKRGVSSSLGLRNNFSYWWMSRLAHACNWVLSPQIDDAIKLMAFEGWVALRQIEELCLVSANHALAECLHEWCARVGIRFTWQVVTKTRPEVPLLQRIYRGLPAVLRAGVGLAHYVIERWPLRGVGVREWRRSDARVSFVSYLFNLAPAALAEKRFESGYWAYLPEALRDAGCKTNWLHLYVKNALVPTASEAALVLRSFQRTACGDQVHVSIDSFLDARVVLRTLRDWMRVAWMSMRLEKQVARTTSSDLVLWPLFADEWRDTMVGAAAMSNLLHLNLFEAAMGSLPEQRTGVYLLENQAWEFGLLQAWRAAGHGQIVGCPHATVRFWDLRYFFDARSYNQSQAYPLPMPDKVAVNGPAARLCYRDGGYPEADLIEVEALRYLHLCDVQNVHAGDEAIATEQPLRLLVLGDYTAHYTDVQMRLLEQATGLLPKNIIITVKPHPACPVRAEDYPNLTMVVTAEPITKLLRDCDVAYTSVATSAAVDAYCAGVPVVSVLDPDTLNLNPLRGQLGVMFASTPVGLAEMLMQAVTMPRNSGQGRDFFHLDTDLPRWKNLLLASLPPV